MSCRFSGKLPLFLRPFSGTIRSRGSSWSQLNRNRWSVPSSNNFPFRRSRWLSLLRREDDRSPPVSHELPAELSLSDMPNSFSSSLYSTIPWSSLFPRRSRSRRDFSLVSSLISFAMIVLNSARMLFDQSPRSSSTLQALPVELCRLNPQLFVGLAVYGFGV